MRCPTMVDVNGLGPSVGFALTCRLKDTNASNTGGGSDEQYKNTSAVPTCSCEPVVGAILRHVLGDTNFRVVGVVMSCFVIANAALGARAGICGAPM
jgi:hypothetical protein